MGRRRLIVVIILGAVLAGAALGTILISGGAAEKQQGVPPATAEELVSINRAFIQVAQAVKPAVVNISTATIIREETSPLSPFFSDPFFRRFFGDQFRIPRERRSQSLGSGVIVDPGGYIITNNHVVEGATEIKVLLDDKREFKAKVVGRDPRTDVAVIKIEARGLPVVAWGDSDKLQVGEWVLAIGNPFGLNQTVTSGIISATGRANVGIADYEDFIQTDAPINPGNSGGALVNLRGELIGINTAIFSQSGGYMGIGFAIPSNMARTVMQSLVKTGKVVRGYLGVEIQDLTPELGKQFGVNRNRGAVVTNVVPGGPAEKGDVKAGDVITDFDGKAIEDGAHLKNLVAQAKVGSRVSLRLIRKGKEETKTILIEEQPARMALASTALAGIEVANLDPATRRKFNMPGDVTGVVITRVDPGSPAFEAGVRMGDVIEQVNQKPVRSVQEFNKLISGITARDEALLLLNRAGSRGYVVLAPS